MKADSDEAQQWFSKFNEMGVSNTTGFNWTALDLRFQSGETIVEDYIRVNAGAFLKLYQIVGKCGGRTIRVDFEYLM